LALRQQVIKELVLGIDEDGAGGIVGQGLNDLPAVSIGKDNLTIWQIGHQLLVARCPAGIARRLLRLLRLRSLMRLLQTAAQRHGDDCEC
jgi:hypothetical protein